MFKNTASQKVIVFAFDSTTNLPKTGDAANITAYIAKDFGAVTVLGDTTATEQDATNAKGYYTFDITQTETNADVVQVTGKSSTSNIVVVGAPATIFTYPTGGLSSPTNITAGTLTTVANLTNLPAITANWLTAAGIAAGALDGKGNWNIGKTGYTLTATTGLGNQTADITGTITTATNLTTNNDKTGYSIATGGVGTGDIDATALNEIADAVLDRVLSAGADSGADTTAARTVRQALRAVRNRVAIAAGTMTVYKENDTTASWTAALTRTAGDPISESNPT